MTSLDLMTWFYALSVVFAVGLGMLVVWARRRLAVKLIALALAGALVGTLLMPLAWLSGRPRPAHLSFLQKAEEAVVLAAAFHEGEAIFLWLQMPDGVEPLSIRLPWDLETAKALGEALEEARRDGNRIIMRGPFEPSWDNREPRFYPLPQPRLPLKPVPETPPPLHWDA